VQLLVRLRVLLARHPSIYWAAVLLATVQVIASVDRRVDRLDEARRSWEQTRVVWVAVADHRPGDPVLVERRSLPVAAVPDAALTEMPRGVVVQHVRAGEILTSADIGDGRFALLPEGWEGVAIDRGMPSLPLEPGDHVGVVGPLGTLADDAVVVSVTDDVAFVAVPAARAADVAIAARERAVALTLRRP
jgi:hypothetical protein